MGVSTFDVINGRVGPDPLTAGLNMGAQKVVIATSGATTDVMINLPVGATLNTILLFNPTNATGAPTNANLTVGKTQGGSEFVAATDVKAAGKTALSFATTNIADILSLPAPAGQQMSPKGNPSPVWFRIAYVGGTAPAMSGTAIVEYTMPWNDPGDGHRL